MKNSIILFCLTVPLMLLYSCSNGYYTIDDFKTIKKVDTHTHQNSENTALMQQAKDDNFKLIAINVDVPGYPSVNEQLTAAMYLQKQFPVNIDFLAAFTLAGWDSANWTSNTIAKLKSDFANGAVGVKVWKNIGMAYKDSANKFIMLDNPKFDSVADFIIQQNKTLVGHLGEPKNCWLPLEQMTVNNDREYFAAHPEYHMYLHPEFPSYDEQIQARDNFVERHPNLRFVGAHLGSLEWSIDELAKRLDKFPNMAVDMADRICHLQLQSQKDREKVRQFFIKYQDRLMYATDAWIDPSKDTEKTKSELHNTWLDDWKYFVTDDEMTSNKIDGSFQGLKLPKQVVDKIYYKNAVYWFKLDN